MGSSIDVCVKVKLSPIDLAEAFWNMASDEQAQFYAALHSFAGHKLCLQTAYLVEEIARRDIAGDSDAKTAFRTLHSHADNYIEVLAGGMANNAKRGIALYALLG